ncbi:MAG: hypothetical protein HRU80_02800 [Ignavibacteriales bacterium]|nr:MAG: hypothetical protein HRU80_02800 [Ignavibacteriales bacterium]
MKWKGKLINYLIEQLKEDSQWGNTIEHLLFDLSIGIHLAIFNEPFLSLVYKKEKKIESRFSVNRRIPFERVKKGDVIILKESGSFVTGVFVAGEVNFFHLADKETLKYIEANFGKAICADYDTNFWKNRAKSKYATLIEVKKIKKIAPYKSEKKDRSGWSILREGISEDLFTQSK